MSCNVPFSSGLITPILPILIWLWYRAIYISSLFKCVQCYYKKYVSVLYADNKIAKFRFVTLLICRVVILMNTMIYMNTNFSDVIFSVIDIFSKTSQLYHILSLIFVCIYSFPINILRHEKRKLITISIVIVVICMRDFWI